MLLDLIELQSKKERNRVFYTKDEKQTIMKYVQRLKPKMTDDKTGKPIHPPPYIPPVEDYVKDMSIILNHIFSYEFKTHQLDAKSKPKKSKEQNTTVPQFDPRYAIFTT